MERRQALAHALRALDGEASAGRAGINQLATVVAAEPDRRDRIAPQKLGVRRTSVSLVASTLQQAADPLQPRSNLWTFLPSLTPGKCEEASSAPA